MALLGLPIAFWQYIIGVTVLMFLFYFALSFLLGGLLGPFLKTKISRGRKLLVRVRHPVHDYFTTGEISENFLVFKGRDKKNRRITMSNGCVYRAATVYWIDVDDEKNCLYKRESGTAVSGFDAQKNDNLFVRALTSPKTADQKMLRLVFILVIIAAAASVFAVWFVYAQGMQIEQILQAVQGTGSGVVE